MTSVEFETIYSRARNKMTDLKETLYLNENDLYEIYQERLYSTLGNPRIAEIFDQLNVDEDKEILSFELINPSSNDFVDREFVVELLSLGIVIEWFKPQVESHEYISAFYGTKEEKSINNQYKNMIARFDNLQIGLYKMIRDRGYIHNEYIEVSK